MEQIALSQFQPAIHAFDHIATPEMRAKVAGDFLSFLDGEGKWAYHRFNARNDYQRHLYALFLRLAGFSVGGVHAALLSFVEDVSESKRASYVDEVLHSVIVGFPRDGELTPIPPQALASV